MRLPDPPIYVLASPADDTSNFFPLESGGKVINVGSDGWYEARTRAFQHALGAGHKSIIVCVGGVTLLHRPHWNGRGEQTYPHHILFNGQHGLWVYMARLLERFHHVYVPAITRCRPWGVPPVPSHCQPTVPWVAGYRIDTLLDEGLMRHRSSLGSRLCHLGYDSWTLGDYFYRAPPGYKADLDDEGSATTWARAYEQFITAVLGEPST